MVIIENGILKCPSCNSDYLHQEIITTIFRDKEDYDGTSVISTWKHVEVNRVKTENIAGRRDFCKIVFSCEGCQCSKTLTIMQHKGQTIIEWQKGQTIIDRQ